MGKFYLSERPALTLMIKARSLKRVEELAERGRRCGCHAFGIQLEQLSKEERTYSGIKTAMELLSDKPVYVTNYPSGEGYDKNADIIAEQLLYAAECGADLVDFTSDLYCRSKWQVTYDEMAASKQQTLAKKLHEMGADVLISAHVLEFLPYEKVKEIAKLQLSRGADVAKIVTAANTKEEHELNLEISRRLKEENVPALFLCVGSECKKHRTEAPYINGGMYFCVAEYDELAAKAQPLLCEALDEYRKYYNKI